MCNFGAVCLTGCWCFSL